LLGKKVFLPLLQSSIVILPLLFKLCDFALVILKRSSRLPLLCNIVCLAGIKWRKLKKKKTPRGKDSNTPNISFHPWGTNQDLRTRPLPTRGGPAPAEALPGGRRPAVLSPPSRAPPPHCP